MKVTLESVLARIPVDTPETLYNIGVRCAYDANFAESAELRKRYYEKAKSLFDRAAMHGHVGAMMVLTGTRLALSAQKTYEKDSKEAPSARTTTAG